MIIDFTVENYRSIKEPVTLSAVAQSRGASRVSSGVKQRRIKADEEIAPAYPVEGRAFELLPVLGIFGANASGKSNVIQALDSLLYFMRVGSGEKGEAMRFMPFKLDELSANAPTRFQLRVVLQDNIYTYTLWVNQHQIYWERLEYAPPLPKRNRLLFDRKWDALKERFEWRNGDDFAGPHVQLEESLNNNEPFITMLVRRISFHITLPLATWLLGRWPGVGLGREHIDRLWATWTAHDLPEYRERVVEIIRRFDTGIADIQLVKREGDTDGTVVDIHDLFAWHDSERGPVRWAFEEESTGTQRLFSLAFRMVLAFERNTLEVVDELGSNIHPNITREIVRLFQDPKTNPKRAQLIFTSHDNTLQRGNLLRRDQIWFTQKRSDGSTELYPLTDFKPRNDLAIDKAYLDGRFGAVPILPSGEDLLPTEELARQ